MPKYHSLGPCASQILSTQPKLGSSGKRLPQLKKCPHPDDPVGKVVQNFLDVAQCHPGHVAVEENKLSKPRKVSQ